LAPQLQRQVIFILTLMWCDLYLQSKN
jgi:hypothetical protein